MPESRWMKKKSMLIIMVLYLFILFSTSSGQSLCACEMPGSARVPCVAGGRLRGSECALAGCCFDDSLFLAINPFSTICYQSDFGRCSRGSSTQSWCQTAIGRAAGRLRCGTFFQDQFSCESSGCCYDPTVAPFCFYPVNNAIQPNPFPSILDPVPSEWGPWSQCTDTCTEGIVLRTRKCINGADEQCLQLGFPMQERKNCNQGKCKRWGQWTNLPCSASCGISAKQSRRICLSGSFPSDECQSFTTPCSLRPCPNAPSQTFYPRPATSSVNWGQWQLWSDCSTSCSPGTQRRIRHCYLNNILTNPQRCSDAFKSENRQDVKNCNQEMCSAWTAWSAYSECDKTCGNAAVRRSARKCFGFSSSGHSSGAFERCSQRLLLCQSVSCDSSIFTVSASSKINSTSFRTTTETATARTNAKSTTPATTTQETASFGSWLNWLPWSACSQSCSRGQRNRIRKCLLNGLTQQNPSSCFGNSIEYEDCNTNFCAEWKEWKQVSPCSETCLLEGSSRGGIETWGRDCIIGKLRLEDNDCFINITSCRTELICPDKQITTKASSATQATSPRSTKSTTTTIKPPPASWSEWGDWSSCSLTCSNGVQNRARECEFGTAAIDCNGSMIQTRDCIIMPCTTVAATETLKVVSSPAVISTNETVKDIGSWGPWGECSESCSPGVQSRERQCKSGPEFGKCSKNSEDIRRCNVEYCESWGQWESSDCDETCGQGKRVRFRTCKTDDTNISPEFCFYEEISCNVESCETATGTPTPPTSFALTGDDKIWKQWSEWTECSATCSPGIQTRERECQPEVDAQICAQGSRDSRACNEQFCQLWGAWRNGPCDKTCGNGKRQRTRKCSTGIITPDISELCYTATRSCNRFNCETTINSDYPKLDVLFLVDSSNFVDDCDKIESTTELQRPINGSRLTSEVAPTYQRMKQFIADFAAGWEGISEDGTRIGIQLISDLCSPKTKRNLHVVRRFDDSSQEILRNIKNMPYLCGEYWLDWAIKCSTDPFFTSAYGDRENVANVVIALLSNAPSVSQPSEPLLKIALRRLRDKNTTILSVAANSFDPMSQQDREKYEDNLKKLACSTERKSGIACDSYLGSIWDTDIKSSAKKVSEVLRKAGKIQ